MNCIPHRQRGTVLFVALIVMVSMAMAGIALVRGVDTQTQVANNVAFRNAARPAADIGIEDARAWLTAQAPATLQSDALRNNKVILHSQWQNTLDFTGSDPLKAPFDWTTAYSVGTDGAGNAISYVIHRLCDASGPPDGVNCVRSTTGTLEQSTKDSPTGGSQPAAATTAVLYRVTVRVIGPRNTVIYAQSILS